MRLGRPRSLNGEQVAEALRLREQGESLSDIASMLGVHRQTLRTALRREPETPVDRSGMSEHAGSSEAQPATQSRVEDRPSWPPLVDVDTVWIKRQLIDRSIVRVRQLELNGRPVEVDEDGRVLCPCCLTLLDLATVLRSTRSEHIVGQRNIALSAVRPISPNAVEPRGTTEIERSRW